MPGFSNAEIQNAGQIQPHGGKYIFKITTPEDLNRRIIKSDSCLISFPELHFEIPAQRGTLSTIEGILTTSLDELSMLQPQRLTADPETFEKIEIFIKKGREFSVGKVLPFTMILDDPAGNSWMSTVCEFCGYKSNEVKTGGQVSEKGRKITLKVEDPDDLTRDILKVSP